MNYGVKICVYIKQRALFTAYRRELSALNTFLIIPLWPFAIPAVSLMAQHNEQPASKERENRRNFHPIFIHFAATKQQRLLCTINKFFILYVVFYLIYNNLQTLKVFTPFSTMINYRLFNL